MDTRLFIVGLCQGEIIDKALLMQKLLSEKYKIYKRRLPPLHLTFEVVEAPEEQIIAKVKDAIFQASLNISSFPIRTNGFACFPPPYKSVGLLIEKNEELEFASGIIKKQLNRVGIYATNPFGKDRVYHLTIVNTFLADRKWSEEEFLEVCHVVDKVPLDLQGMVMQIALWHPTKVKETMSEGTFPLQNRKVVSINLET